MSNCSRTQTTVNRLVVVMTIKVMLRLRMNGLMECLTAQSKVKWLQMTSRRWVAQLRRRVCIVSHTVWPHTQWWLTFSIRVVPIVMASVMQRLRSRARAASRTRIVAVPLLSNVAGTLCVPGKGFDKKKKKEKGWRRQDVKMAKIESERKWLLSESIWRRLMSDMAHLAPRTASLYGPCHCYCWSKVRAWPQRPRSSSHLQVFAASSALATQSALWNMCQQGDQDPTSTEASQLTLSWIVQAM